MKKEDIKELMELFSETSNITKMKLKEGDIHIELEKETTQTPVFSAQPTQALQVAGQEMPQPIQPLPVEQKLEDFSHITSPMVGTFYCSPAPGAKPYVNVGDVISKGQTVAIVEAMKIMNEIEAEYDCKIVKVLLEDGQPVEYNMPLYEVEKI